jgi:hypothetical protein
MQTFLPYPDYTESAKALDSLRLGKQRVEVLQMLNVLHEVSPSNAWSNHPAVRMWRGYELQLAEYGMVVTDEWIARGNADTCMAKLQQHVEWAESGEMLKPDWFGDPALHDSHKSNLLRKANQYLLIHTDEPHDEHWAGKRKCPGDGCHKPHNKCEPLRYVEWYHPLFPGVPDDLSYIWPVP